MNSEVLLIWVSFIESFCGHPYEKQNSVSTNLCSKDVDEWSRRLHTSGILLMLGITTAFEYRNMSLSESTPNPEVERHPLILCGKFCPMPAAGVWVMDSVFWYDTSAVLLNHKLLLLISLFCPSEFSWCDRIPSWYSMRWLMPICHCLQVDVNGSKSVVRALQCLSMIDRHQCYSSWKTTIEEHSFQHHSSKPVVQWLSTYGAQRPWGQGLMTLSQKL